MVSVHCQRVFWNVEYIRHLNKVQNTWDGSVVLVSSRSDISTFSEDPFWVELMIE